MSKFTLHIHFLQMLCPVVVTAILSGNPRWRKYLVWDMTTWGKNFLYEFFYLLNLLFRPDWQVLV